MSTKTIKLDEKVYDRLSTMEGVPDSTSFSDRVAALLYAYERGVKS